MFSYFITVPKTALAFKRHKGQRIGTVPYGFDLADDGTTLIENPTEQAAIADIHRMRTEGATLKRIASELTDPREMSH